MRDSDFLDEHSIHILKERAKELNCLYQVDEILSNQRLSLAEMFEAIVAVVPSGWQYPEVCEARILFDNHSYQTPGYIKSKQVLKCPISIDETIVGSIEVVYTRPVPASSEGIFLDKERKLIQTIAERIGQTLFHRRLKQVLQEWNRPRLDFPENHLEHEWMVILDLLRRTDPNMLLYVSRKMINHLYRNGITEAGSLLNDFSPGWQDTFSRGEVNYPSARVPLGNINTISEKTFQIAARHLSDQEISLLLKRWIQEQKTYDLIKTVDRIDASLGDIVEAIKRYREIAGDSPILYSATERWLAVALIRRFLSDNLDFIQVARQYLGISHFYEIAKRLIYPEESRGKIGGKSTGLFLAQQVLKKESHNYPLLSRVKVPRTWCITTDELTEVLHYNNLEGLNEQKYRDLQEIRMDYPNIIQMLKNAKFPQNIVKSLAMVLDDLGDTPLIVRSSSLLEDQMGAAFSGKYKSLFLANRGSKKERLDALMEAILEVYASVYGPDSIRYRAERGLLDFHEEMGIMIQQVVGKKIGPYFMPLYSGVAVSNNEYRWSSRIKREDGLIRLVMGLGTRAVDRLKDDFPFLIAPGQPDLRVNIVPEEIKYYSPKKVDVINLETNSFETVSIAELLKHYGHEMPFAHHILSKYSENLVESVNAFQIDFKKDDLVVNFEGLITGTAFVRLVRQILEVLQEKLGTPVDIEFASDGEDFYLLQCRPQGLGEDAVPAPLPQDIPKNKIVFTARRYITNGQVENISHVVYVDPEAYSQLQSISDLLDVGRAVGMLNVILPRRRFILIGPGRWGSRGDIKMGAQVTYADINNTAALIEIARQRSSYVPELSFGTHFFQDLVEANIRYLPLYPDDRDVLFNEKFLTRSPSILTQLLPDYKHIEHVVRVIDVTEASHGSMLHIHMNAELGEAIGYLGEAYSAQFHAEDWPKPVEPLPRQEVARYDDSYWRWRMYMAERIAAQLDGERLGVKAAYLIGSTNSGTAGPGSDIDLIIHVDQDSEKCALLKQWLDGWSKALAEMNYLKTGYNSEGLLDVHFITDEDLAKKSSFAAKIGAITDPALPLKLKSKRA